jgi:ATP-dependent protease ClpP protease subunit
VEAGLAIAELIASMKKPVVSLILGGGHSIGVPLAVSARYSFIAPSATMTVHPVRLNGPIVGTQQTITYFERIQDRIIRFVSDNSRITPERYRQLMSHNGDLMADVGSLLNGDDAVREGIIDSVGGLKDALAKLEELCDNDVHGL